jgi:hypothetical protein
LTRTLAAVICAAAACSLAQPALVRAVASPDSALLRRQAKSILAERRFHSPRLPRPLHGFFASLGRALKPVGRAISRFVAKLSKLVPGGGFVLWPVLAALVLLAVLVLTRRSVRRRARAESARETGRHALALRADDADALEAQAEEASREGDLDLALRLRFRAGLVRLDARKAIELRPSLTTGEVARALRSPVFAGLASSFDEVTYGGRSARAEEIEAARSDWPRVLEEAGRR